MNLKIALASLASVQLVTQIASQLLVVRHFGISSDTDVYIAAQAVPVVLTGLISAALQSVWLPRLVEVSDAQSNWQRRLSEAYGHCILLMVAFFVPVIGSASIWIRYLYSGFDEGQLLDVLFYSQVLLVASIFNIVTALMTTAMQTQDRFVVVDSISLISSLLAFVLIYVLLPVYGLTGVVFISLLRSIAVFGVLFVLNGNLLPDLRAGISDKSAWILIWPILVGTSVYKTYPIVDRYWAAMAPSGDLTILALASMIIGAVITVLYRSMAMPIVPAISRLVSLGKFDEVRSSYNRHNLKVALLIIVLAIVSVLLKGQLVVLIQLVFSTGELAATSIWYISFLLLGHLYVAITGPVLVAVFYALNDTVTPVRIGLTGFLIGIILKALLFVEYGIDGLVIATSIYFMCNFLLFIYFLDRRLAVKLV